MTTHAEQITIENTREILATLETAATELLDTLEEALTESGCRAATCDASVGAHKWHAPARAALGRAGRFYR